MTDPTPDGPAATGRSELAMRLLYLVLVALLLGAAILLVDRGQPNPQIAAFGKSLGAWLGKAIRFQTAASDDKPWPWSPLG